MRILYLSCHAILEYDELKLFDELGLDVFSFGDYTIQNQNSSLRPPISDKESDKELVEKTTRCQQDHLSRELVENFDVIMIMHLPHWVKNNWEVIKDKTVIWRTIGQSNSDVESTVAPYREKGLKIVRYSEKEKTIPGYVGEDATIKFYKDPDELKDWNGKEERVITIAQNMLGRNVFCSYEQFLETTKGFDRKLFGPKNEAAGEINGGMKTYEELKTEYRNNRAYFYTGTHPASYTLNFIEAFMTGIPIVAIGKKYGNMPSRPDCANLYEIPEIITNYENGFCSDNLQKLRNFMQILLDDKQFAKKIGANGRKKAIELFGKETIKKQWKEFWEGLK